MLLGNYGKMQRAFAEFSVLLKSYLLRLKLSIRRNYAPSTVNTYVSALGYSHKLSGLPDPTRVFYIIQMLKG